MTRYDVRHRTTFNYEEMVSVSRHVLHLVPRTYGRQRCTASTIDVTPTPTQLSASSDYFGNRVNHVTIQQPHDKLIVEAYSRVEVVAPAEIDKSESTTWESVATQMRLPEGNAVYASDFVHNSPFATYDARVVEYAAGSFKAGRSMLEATLDLTKRIFTDFEYKGGLSDVYTPVDAILKMRKGVCQDFAHLQIACLHSVGLPARYVSGYLLTHPPPGQPRLVGADASHAWISAWIGDLGWVDFDPTNNVIPSDEHITVGWGRDYGDVSPINGFILGGGHHEVRVEVDVTPVV